MVRITVVPERLQALSQQMAQAASTLRDLDGRLGRALGGLDWEVRQQANVEGQVQAARSQAHALAEQAEAMARLLSERAQAFQQADQQGAEALGAATQRYIAAVPVPTPAPAPAGKPAGLPFSEIIKTLDDLLKPIDWISDSRQASRAFDKTLENIGRMLNSLTGHRGHIKMMTQFGEFLRGASQGTGFLSNVLDARDMHRYFAGELTNAQIAEVALKVLIPIPILNDRIAEWAIQNMVDPNGRWRGLVPTVE